MKLCVTIGTDDAFHGALIVFKGLKENIKSIAELGYDGIELALFSKKSVDITALKRLLNEYRLELPVISTGQIFTMQKAWFTHPDIQIRNRAVRVFCEIIDVASEFGADINVSRVRGYIHEGDTQNEALKRLTDCLEKICSYAAKYSLNIVLEQMNRYETNYLNSVAEVGEYIKTLEIENLKIHADLFHMNIEDVSMTGVLEQYRNLLGYIHFADSNRLAPGRGHIDFSAITSTLKKIDYKGWAGIEVLTIPDCYTAAKQSIDYVRSIL